ncbi:Two-component sensor histidine kinase [Minicystis rosea]|nr:Two-component sensor histidine kinase [Minicystis rosea]
MIHFLRRVVRAFGRIGIRLLIVNLVVLLVPVVGLEFARIHERQLNEALERDMKNQAALVRALVESDLAAGIPLGDPRQIGILTEAAKSTRTRVRLLDPTGEVLADSHEAGPPEGPEQPPPHILPRRAPRSASDEIPYADMRRDAQSPGAWPELADRAEVRTALRGAPSSRTRLRARDPGVFFFIAEPVFDGNRIAGAVYAVRSTRPVMVELYRIRAGLMRVLCVAFAITGTITLLLAYTLSRPLVHLSRAAKRVAAGEKDVVVPIGGSGEIAELAESFALMKERLDARMRYISEFAADVAHEFKSPLTSIRGAAELLEEGAADDPEARARFLRNIELDVARLDRLVSRLLELSRIEASSQAMTPVSLPALLSRTTARASAPDQPVELRYRASVRELRAREMDLETAILNLLDNAVRFSPSGVPVVVEVDGGASVVQIAVIDRGPGISPANLPKIFDRFFTTDADKDGTGLGLAIAKTVVEAHGGTIQVTSEPSQGAIFTVTLPVRK